MFSFDPIGNRTNLTEGAGSGTYTTNNLNQYAASTLPANSYTHDEDGNLASISGSEEVTFTYDAENRLISAEPTTPVVGDTRLDFVYDYQGRRVEKIISTWSGSWSVTDTRHFIYDGWNMIQEISTVNPTRYYVWGLDISGSLQGAGGVGGLLTMVEGTNSYAYLMDGNGNVGQLVDNSDGSIDAHYEYDPFGSIINSYGILAATNPFRFSTKYFDAESGLYYYGYRYYDPQLGRWLNRDPIEEEGGLNFYGFVNNDPIDLIDPFGEDFIAVGTRKLLFPVLGGVGGLNHMSIYYFKESAPCTKENTEFQYSKIPSTATQAGFYELLNRKDLYMRSYTKGFFKNKKKVEKVSVSVIYDTLYSASVNAERFVVIFADASQFNSQNKITEKAWERIKEVAKDYDYALQSNYFPKTLDSSNWPNVRYVASTKATNSNTFIRFLARSIGRDADVLGKGDHWGAQFPQKPEDEHLKKRGYPTLK